MAGVHVGLPSDKLFAAQGYRQGLEASAAGAQAVPSHSSVHLPSVRKQLFLQVGTGQALHFLLQGHAGPWP